MGKSGEMILLSDAFGIVDSTLAGKCVETKKLALSDALGYVLAADQVSKLQLPPFNKSAMDGYAVCADDDRDEYKVLEFVPAGSVPTLALTKGCATKVMTGAAVAENAGKVIMVEFTEEKDGIVKVKSHSSRSNICKMGEDVKAGDTILYAPVRIGALEIANLVSCGIETVEVFEPVRVTVISTGDEIVDSFDKIVPGKIMNSNGPLLCNLCKQNGLEVVASHTVADDRTETAAAISKAVDGSDIVILSGGVSMGDLDFVDTAMRDIGLDVHYNRVAVKPGKPMTYATKDKKAIFGLPGNPVSVYLMFHIFVMRAVKTMLGMDSEIEFINYELAEDFKRKKNDRAQFVPCEITKEAKIKPIKYHGSAHLAALMQADGFFVIEKGISEIAKGKTVSFMST